MLKNLLKSQKLRSKIKEFKDKDVFDIVVYGSVVRGKYKANDIDIAIILNKNKKVSEKLELAERLKSKIDCDVKTVDLSDLYDDSFVARQAILAEGYSLITKEFLHERFGFKAFVVFRYSLNGMTYSQKKMFYYALKGRRGGKGLLELKGAEMMGDCVVKVPLVNSEEFEELFKGRNIEYKKDKCMLY